MTDTNLQSIINQLRSKASHERIISESDDSEYDDRVAAAAAAVAYDEAARIVRKAIF